MTGACSCGCGVLTVVTRAAHPCTCGCACCEGPRSKNEEIQYLRVLHEAVERRLGQIEPYGRLFRTTGMGPSPEYRVLTAPVVAPDEVAAFARAHVDLPQDEKDRYRAGAEDVVRRIAGIRHTDLIGAAVTGSIAKGTACAGLRAVDVAVYLRRRGAPSEAGDVHARVAGILGDGFGDELVQVSGSLVRPAPDGPDVVVLPVVVRDESDRVGRVFLPGGARPVITSLAMQVDNFVRVDREHGGRLAAAVRLLKWWGGINRARDPDFRLDPVVAELICLHVARLGVPLAGPAAALERVFAYIVGTGLEERISSEDGRAAGVRPPVDISDSGNPSNNVAATYTTKQRVALVRAAEESLDALAEAYYASERRGAVAFWRHVLGPSFGP